MIYFFLRRHALEKQNVGEPECWYEIIENVREHPLGTDQERHICVVHSEKTGIIMVNELNKQRAQGVIEGMTRFAWWKDGMEYVGTCGTTLQQAIADFRRERGE